MPETEKRKQWTKDNTSYIGLKLNNRQDSDILQALDGKPKQTEIKRLLRLAIEIEKER